MTFYLPIAFLAGGNSPVGLPVLLLAGLYFFENRIAKLTCRVLLVIWLVWITVYSVWNAEWVMLIFPGLMIIAWGIISEINKSFG